MFPAVSPQLGVMGKASNFSMLKTRWFFSVVKFPSFGSQPRLMAAPRLEVAHLGRLPLGLAGGASGRFGRCLLPALHQVRGRRNFFAACVFGIGADFCRQPLGIEPFSYGLDPGDFVWFPGPNGKCTTSGIRSWEIAEMVIQQTVCGLDNG